MSATSKILNDLQGGLVVSSSNKDRRKYRVRNLPDVIYQLKKKHDLLIEKATKNYMVNGSRYTTTYYWLERV